MFIVTVVVTVVLVRARRTAGMNSPIGDARGSPLPFRCHLRRIFGVDSGFLCGGVHEAKMRGMLRKLRGIKW
jgi:hypothetical protein